MKRAAKNFEYIDLFRMVARVIQTQAELDEIDHHDYYDILWDGPNTNIGTYRCDHLKNNCAQNKRHVMSILRIAYNQSINQEKIKFASFDDAISFCKHMGIRIIHTRYSKKSSRPDIKWLA